MATYIRLTDYKSSYEKLRIKIIEKQRINTMVHLEPRAFEEIGSEVVQSVVSVLEKDGMDE